MNEKTATAARWKTPLLQGKQWDPEVGRGLEQLLAKLSTN
jgi:hypothetical protein